MFKQVQVETTNICNSHCQFCPHDKYKTTQTMTEKLYKKIVDDCAQYDLDYFMPMLNGEPFCDKKIMSRIKYARSRLAERTVIKLFTNGSLITKPNIDELAEMSNVKLSISINGPTKEIRENLMGLSDYNEVVDKIYYAESKGILVEVSTVFHPTLYQNQINALSKFPHAALYTMHNWAGELYKYKRTMPTNCVRVREILTILVTGDAVLCCFDPFGKVVFGNLNDMTIKEIWGSQGHQKYLDYHSQGRGQELPLCKNCTQG